MLAAEKATEEMQNVELVKVYAVLVMQKVVLEMEHAATPVSKWLFSTTFVRTLTSGTFDTGFLSCFGSICGNFLQE